MGEPADKEESGAKQATKERVTESFADRRRAAPDLTGGGRGSDSDARKGKKQKTAGDRAAGAPCGEQ
ncbi:hypothetical protein GCM10022262_39170 [Georgenia daeguensis]|uniref:Uncharacterized protein n=1 Tax=Georgenia daeguensis TaxID=908355 RepID=A0ABP6ULY5_9MICO